MNMSYLRVNTGECPIWGVEVSVYGMYGECEDGTWKFLHADCPIIENSKLAIHEQDPKYKMMFCQGKTECPLYTRFQPSTTSAI